MLMESNLKMHQYDTRDVVRIKNPKQRDFYLFNNIVPVDIYPSEDQNGKKILVYLFLKKDTQELYQRWLNYDVD